MQIVECKNTLMESENDTLFLYQKCWFLIQSSIANSYLSCVVMSHGHGIIWMAFGLYPKPKLCNNTFEKQLQYYLYKKFNVKRDLWNQKRTLDSGTRKVGFYFSLQFQLVI